jgi:hypothetical protein
MPNAPNPTQQEPRVSQTKLLLVALFMALVGLFQAIARKTLRR